jgi:hypothetical protein
MRNLPLQLDNLRLVLSHQVCDFELMARLNFNRDFILFSDLEQLKLQWLVQLLQIVVGVFLAEHFGFVCSDLVLKTFLELFLESTHLWLLHFSHFIDADNLLTGVVLCCECVCRDRLTRLHEHSWLVAVVEALARAVDEDRGIAGFGRASALSG